MLTITNGLVLTTNFSLRFVQFGSLFTKYYKLIWFFFVGEIGYGLPHIFILEEGMVALKRAFTHDWCFDKLVPVSFSFKSSKTSLILFMNPVKANPKYQSCKKSSIWLLTRAAIFHDLTWLESEVKNDLTWLESGA